MAKCYPVVHAGQRIWILLLRPVYKMVRHRGHHIRLLCAQNLLLKHEHFGFNRLGIVVPVLLLPSCSRMLLAQRLLERGCHRLRQPYRLQSSASLAVADRQFLHRPKGVPEPHRAVGRPEHDRTARPGEGDRKHRARVALASLQRRARRRASEPHRAVGRPGHDRPSVLEGRRLSRHRHIVVPGV